MHRLFIAAIIFLSSFAPAKSAPGMDSLQKVRDCLAQVPTVQDFKAHKKLAGHCLQLASGSRHAVSVSARSLYVKALGYLLEPDGTLHGFERIDQKLSSYYRNQLEPLLNSRGIDKFSDQELTDSLNGVFSATFYHSIVSSDQLGLGTAERIFAVLTARNKADSDSANNLLRFTVRNSNWIHAEDLAKAWPQLEIFPHPILLDLKPGQIGYFNLSPSLNTLTMVPASLDQGKHILLSGSCHFAVSAIEKLALQPGLSKIMAEFGIVLASDDDTDFKRMDELRTKFPEYEFHPIFRSSDWTMRGYDVLSSPSFDFVENGVVKFRFMSDGPHVVQNFCEGLKAIHIKQREACTPDSI